jgi:hypothetical protein
MALTSSAIPALRDRNSPFCVTLPSREIATFGAFLDITDYILYLKKGSFPTLSDADVAVKRGIGRRPDEMRRAKM